MQGQTTTDYLGWNKDVAVASSNIYEARGHILFRGNGYELPDFSMHSKTWSGQLEQRPPTPHRHQHTGRATKDVHSTTASLLVICTLTPRESQ